MNRDAFCGALRAKLSGMSPDAIDDIVSDYDAHFRDGAADGRSEDEIAAALGDPARLARELRAESGLKRWEEKRSPGNAIAAVFGLIGLGAIDVIFLLPILAVTIIVLGALFIACIGVFIGGAATLTFGPFAHPPGGAIAAILFGLGMIAGAVSASSILSMITIGGVNAIVWYARLHYRLIRPTQA